MKKVYETPAVEKIAFQYRDQVVAASGEACKNVYVNIGTEEQGECAEGNEHLEYLN